MDRYDRIALIDFGGQYAHLIATKVRRLGVLCEIQDPQAPIDVLRGYQGIILSGSPAFSSADEGPIYTTELFDLDIPVLGFCFGHQEVAKRYGGTVEHVKREYGLAVLELVALPSPSPLFAGLGPRETVWMSHWDSVTELPDGFVELGFTTTDDGSEHHPNAAIGDDQRRRYGFQFHPEVDDTVHGQEMLANFVLTICGCKADWTVANYLEDIQEEIRREVGDRKVLLLASGGVDSTVTAKLLAEALGPDRLWLLHVDNGLMRKDESRRVVDELTALGLGSAVHFVDASHEFLTALAGVVEPERKRRIIGDQFIAIVEREAKNLDLDDFVLAQGTIYPDRIETGGSRHAEVIKTHHNRVPIIEAMIEAGRVVEPLRELYKTEVRELGRGLGIDPQAIDRHPFPGPGLGIRTLCADGTAPARDDSAVAALADVLAGSGLQGTLLPIRSVGVKGDLRSYEQPVMLSGPRPGDDELLALAARVYKEVAGVNRCVLALGDPALDQIEVVAAGITSARLALLRELDAFVMDGLARHGLMETVWQCPTVLVPLRVGGRGQELVILRPVLSERAMTALPALLPTKLTDEIASFAASLDDVSAVAIDLSTKPPGTIEWE